MAVLTLTEVSELPASPTLYQMVYLLEDDVVATVFYAGDAAYVCTDATTPTWTAVTDPVVAAADRITAVALTSVNYYGADFWTILDQLQGFLKARFPDDWRDFSQASAGQAMIEAIAFLGEMLTWLGDRKVGEAYLTHARLLHSLSLIARKNGYKVTGATSANCDGTIQLDAAYGHVIEIPAGFQVNGPNGLVFETTARVTFDASHDPLGSQAKAATFREGKTKQIVMVSSGAKRQRFRLRGLESGKYLLNGGNTVKVNGATWTELDFLEWEGGQTYQVDYTLDPPELAFGDGYNGDVPPEGAEIFWEYVQTSGRPGNAANVGDIDSEVRALVVASSTIGLVITNTEGARGGDNPEDIESVRANAGKFQASQERAITDEDILTLASSYVSSVGNGRLAKAQARRPGSTESALIQDMDQIKVVTDAAGLTITPWWTRVRASIVDAIDGEGRANIVEVYCLSQDSTDDTYVAPSTALLTELQTYLQARQDAAAVVLVYDGSVNLTDVDFTIAMTVDTTRSYEVVKAQVEEALSDLLTGRNYGVDLYRYQYYAAVREITDFDAIETLTITPSGADASGNVTVDATSILQIGSFSWS